MSKELKTIHVSEEVWRRLVELKLELKLRSIDEVVKWLLAHFERKKGGGRG